MLVEKIRFPSVCIKRTAWKGGRVECWRPYLCFASLALTHPYLPLHSYCSSTPKYTFSAFRATAAAAATLQHPPPIIAPGLNGGTPASSCGGPAWFTVALEKPPSPHQKRPLCVDNSRLRKTYAYAYHACSLLPCPCRTCPGSIQYWYSSRQKTWISYGPPRQKYNTMKPASACLRLFFRFQIIIFFYFVPAQFHPTIEPNPSYFSTSTATIVIQFVML